METITIAKEIYDSTKRLQKGSTEIFLLAKEKAEKERNYRRALALEILSLREEKTPATLVPDIARGATAELKYQRDLADAKYTACRDSLDAIKQQINGLQSILRYQTEV